MAKLTEQELKKEISSDLLKSVYYIYGDEKYLVKKYTAALINKAVGKNPSEFDFQKLNSNSELEEIFSSAQQIPMFSKRKCVCVNDFDFEKVSENDMKQLEEFCSDLPSETVLIFSNPTFVHSEKRVQSGEKKQGKTKHFVSICEKYGSIAEFQKKDNTVLEKQLISWAEKNGSHLTSANASKIIAVGGNDMTTLKNETDKLSAYSNGSEITEEMIKLLLTKSTEVRVFALSASISKADYNGAYNQLYSLFEQNEKPEIILSVLSSTFVDMYRMRVASESSKTASDVAKDFKYGKREFVLNSAANNSRRYSTKTLRKILDIILDTDIKLKSTRAESRTLFETLISRLIIATREGQND